MKKHLNTVAVVNELKGASSFFPPRVETREAVAKSVSNSPAKPAPGQESAPAQPGTPPSYLDKMLEEIRKVIKEPGKEVSYVRLTKAEKDRLADIIYSYQRQGIKTSETEIGRLAINYLIEDYRVNGKASLLARLLARLHD